MITKDKLLIFKFYKGYYDGFYIQNKNKTQIISDEDWIALNNLLQDIYLVRNKLASESFENKTKQKVIDICDNKNTIDLVYELEKYLNKKE